MPQASDLDEQYPASECTAHGVSRVGGRGTVTYRKRVANLIRYMLGILLACGKEVSPNDAIFENGE